MSKTVSFRASEELDEFLEQEAERRMTTKSTVAQMLLAERVRELQGERSESSSDPESAPEPKGSEPEEEAVGESGDGGEPAILEQHNDKWYTPDSQEGYKYAVRMPDGDRKYYKTPKHAADRLRKEYGE